MITRPLPHQSNKATFSDFIEFSDDSGPIDISTVSEISIRVMQPECRLVLLEATKTGGTVVETSTGTVQFTFTPSQMAKLCAGAYEFGVLVTINGVTEQTQLSPLYVVDGL